MARICAVAKTMEGLNRIEIGMMLEEEALPLLRSIFDKVYWKSIVSWTAPYDFRCVKNGVDVYVDVKSFRSKIIIMSYSKYEKLTKGMWKPYYFFLYDGKEFNLVSFEEAKKKNIIAINNHEIDNIGGINGHCKACGYNWTYKGNNSLATCPSCLLKVKV